MKLLCPRCNARKNIGDASRFYIFRCDSCGWRFRGVQANVARGDYLLNYFNPFAGRSYGMFEYDKTPCPFCGRWVALGYPVHPSGFAVPFACCHCTRELPRQFANQNDNNQW